MTATNELAKTVTEAIAAPAWQDYYQPVNNMRIKGQQYLEFYRAVKDLPRNLGGVFCYCLTSAGDYLHEVWLEPGTHISPIVEELRPHAGFLSE